MSLRDELAALSVEVLADLDGHPDADLAARFGVSRSAVTRHRRRLMAAELRRLVAALQAARRPPLWTGHDLLDPAGRDLRPCTFDVLDRHLIRADGFLSGSSV